MTETHATYEITPASPAPLQSLDDMVTQFELYQQVCKAILTDDDYGIVHNRRFRKRSGWTKLRRAFNVSVVILDEERFERGEVWGYKFVVQASLPNLRAEQADGLYSSDESEEIGLRPTEHDVRARALTRAKNRATSDILGAGIMSAEEVDAGHEMERGQWKQRRPGGASAPPAAKTTIASLANESKRHWIEREDARKGFWRWTRQDLALSSDEVHEALGVTHVRDFPGSMHDAKLCIEAYMASKAREQVPEEAKREEKEDDEHSGHSN